MDWPLVCYWALVAFAVGIGILLGVQDVGAPALLS